MEAPYRTGDRAVFISDDPSGMRVRQTTVLSVSPDGDGWSVRTTAGTERVDERGEGAQLVPLDAAMAAEFEGRGSSFVVISTHEEGRRDQHRHELEARNHAFDRDHRRDPGQGR